MHDVTKRETLNAVGKGATTDRGSKILWNNKEIVAPFLYMLVPEFEGMTTAEVMQYMDSDILSEELPVNDVDASSGGLQVQGDDTAFSSANEKEIYFDKYFTVVNPRSRDSEKKTDVEWPETLREEAGAVLTMEDYVGRRREAKGMQITLDILDRRSEFPDESYEKTAEAVGCSIKDVDKVVNRRRRTWR